MSVSGSLRLSDGAAGSVAGSSSVSRASRSSRRRRRQKAVAWLPRGSTVLQGKQSISSSLTAEIVAFAHRVQRCQAQGRDALLQLLGRLRLSAAQLWPSSILELYGSCATGIHLASSDIDLMLTVRAASSAGVSPGEVPEQDVVDMKVKSAAPLVASLMLLQEFGEHLVRSGCASSATTIDSVLPPLLKVTTTDGYSLDISLAGGAGSHTGRAARNFVQAHLHAFPELPYLVLVCKAWLGRAQAEHGK
ncbi:unnamed protein product, partial [Symbiodinium sp. KB8]